MAMTLEQFGQKIKSQHPEYSDISDADLGKKVLDKYPQYSDMVDLQSGKAQSSPATKPVRKKGFLQSFGEGVGQALLGAGEIAKGAIKGVGSTIANIGDIGTKYVIEPEQKLIQKVTGQKGPTLAEQTLQKSKEFQEKKLTPSNTAQKVGKAAEQVAEFLAPGGAATKVGKVLEAGAEATKAGKAVKTLANLAGRGATEATTMAATTALQGGKKSDIKAAATIGAVSPVVGKVAEKVLSKIPETAWSALLKRTQTEAAKNVNLPKQAAETGITGLTRKAIAQNAGNQIQQIEVHLDDVLSKSKGVIDGAKISTYLDGILDSYKNIPGEQSSVKAIQSIKSDLEKKGVMTAKDANKLKRDIYQLIEKSYGKGTLEIPAKTEAQKMAAHGLKQELENVAPEIKDLNAQQAVYLQLQKAIRKSMLRTEGKGVLGTGIGLYDLIIGGLGGATHGTEGIVAGIAAKKALESPGFLTGVAKLAEYYNQLSPTKQRLLYQTLQGITSTASRQ